MNGRDDLCTSLTIDNVLQSDVGRILDALREAGFGVEINVVTTPPPQETTVRVDQTPIKVEPEPRAPKPAIKHRAKRNGVAPVDWGEVAKVYITAVAADAKPIDAMCRHFDVERTVAKNWPGKMRQLGLIPPLGEPAAPRADTPMQFVQHGREPLQ